MHGYLGVLIGCAAALGLPPALVSTWHARIDPRAGPSSRIWWYSRLALRIPKWRGAHFIAVTEDIARDYRVRGAPEKRVHVVRNGIIAPALTGLQVAERSRGVPLRVAAIGRLILVKDFSLLLRVARVLAEREVEAVFTIAGDGPLLAELEAEAAALSVAERIHFVGRLEDVSGLLARTDALIFTSRSEGVPYALLEALAAGLPVVAPPVGGFLEVLRHEESALIAADRSPEAIADCLVRLVENGSLRQSLATGAASAAAGELSARRMLRETRRVYTAACTR
jgi:glycosyltransferase involved in cell wall biosynthesis